MIKLFPLHWRSYWHCRGS